MPHKPLKKRLRTKKPLSMFLKIKNGPISFLSPSKRQRSNMLSALTLVDKTVNSPKNNANLLFVLSKPTVTDGKSLRKRTFLPILTAKSRLSNLIRFTRPTMKLLITLN